VLDRALLRVVKDGVEVAIGDVGDPRPTRLVLLRLNKALDALALVAAEVA
jgi:hypothetical protein